MRKNGARLAQNIRWLGRIELLEVAVAINVLHRLEKGGEARCRIFFVVASSRNTGFEGGESQAHFFLGGKEIKYWGGRLSSLQVKNT